MSNTNGLNVIVWNVQSILSKIPYLLNYLANNSIDLVLINETWLSSSHQLPETITNHYEYYRQDRITPHGGVCIFIKKSIPHKLFNIVKNLKVIEAIGIQLNDINGKAINLISTYYPGGNKRTYFQEDLDHLTNNVDTFYICGDLNAHHISWNCATSNVTGNILYNMSQDKKLKIKYTTEPTRYPPSEKGIPSTIDLVVTNDQLSDVIPEIEDKLRSDHVAIKFILLNHAPHNNPGILVMKQSLTKDIISMIGKQYSLEKEYYKKNRQNQKLKQDIDRLKVNISKAYKLKLKKQSHRNI